MTIRNCSIVLIQSIVITEENSKLLIVITLIFIVEEFDCMLSYIVESYILYIIIIIYVCVVHGFEFTTCVLFF